MPSRSFSRSTGGCLTCKKRKKKCDETRPICQRCINGDFDCLGYENANTPDIAATAESDPSRGLASLFDHSTSINQPSNEYIQELSQGNLALFAMQPTHINSTQDTVPYRGLNYVPRGIPPDPFTHDGMVSLIVYQFIKLSARVMFKPFRIIHEAELTYHIANRISDIKRWSWYLGATITQALFDGYQLDRHIGLINRFTRRITSSDETIFWQPDAPGLGDKLSCLEDLVHYVLMTSNSIAGYSLLKLCTPVFLQLAAKVPYIWTPTSAISLGHALHGPMHEMRKFVFWDTMAAVAFGSAPLLHYDTVLSPTLPKPGHGSMILEWVYGCPAEIAVLFAKVNGWRVSRWMDSSFTARNDNNGWREIEARAKRWTAGFDQAEDSAAVVARLAVQESMRQAVLIYLYMGMCGADSTDPRVEPAVRQIVQLAGTIEPGSPLEIHLVMPCLIAGAAARKEQHRSLLRGKLQVSRNESVWCLRGDDFVSVLDHLWHGAGSGGYPVTWEDYVDSRCVILPLDA